MLKVLVPTTITDALFVSSTVAEADNPAWAVGTTYALAAKVMYQHRNYESLAGSNLGNTPTDINSTWWLDLGPTNRWAMFDTITSTDTTSTGVAALVAVVAPGICNGVALLNISGAQSVTVATNQGYSQTQTLDNTFISNWYEYFFEPYDVKSDVLFGPLPPFGSAQITITVTPTVTNGTCKLGAAMFGNTVELGEVGYGATAGITDYSRKETDDFGITTLVQRGFAKKTDYPLFVENSQLRRVFSTLSQLRATPAVWVGSDNYQLSPLTVFGWIEDFGLNVQYPNYSTLSLTIQGLL